MALKKKKPRPGKKTGAFPPTSIRMDPDLAYRGKQLALKNQRHGLPNDTFSKVVNAALADYLKKR